MESVIRYIVSNRGFSILMFLLIFLAAWINLPGIRISQYPSVELPTLMVHVALPGASAREIEQRIINVVEEKLQNTRNLDKFTSKIHGNYATITITFEYGVDLDDECVEVNAKINNIKPSLPDDTEITVLKQSPVDLIVSFVLGVTSATATQTELQQVADTLTSRLRNISSIEDVAELSPDKEIRIDLDLARIEATGLTIQSIEQAIRGNNQYLPTGTFNIGDKALSVLAFGRGYKNLDEIRNTLVVNREGRALAIHDIATVTSLNRTNSVTTEIDGKPAVLITMKLGHGANIFGTRSELEKVTTGLDKPEDIDIVWLFDAEPGVRVKLVSLIQSILIGLLILVVVLLFAVGLRSAFIISMTLPFALFLSVIGLSFTQYGIQEVSLAGFIIALGLIVDNGIVVTENAYKLNHYGGLSYEEAAVKGTAAVVSPLLSSTATTALAFAPLFLLTSITGLFLHSLVVVIWLCLGASLIAAMVISTVMIARIGTENRVPYLFSPPSFLISLIPVRDNFYKNLLRDCIEKPWWLLLVIGFLLAVTVSVARTLPVIVFPDSDDPYLTVNIEAPRDRNGEFVKKLSRKVYNMVAQHPEIEICTVVQGGSFPMVNTGISRVSKRRNNAQIFCSVNFRDAEKLNHLTQQLNDNLKQFAALANIRARPFTVGGEGRKPDIEIKLSGLRIEELRSLSKSLEEHIRQSGLSGIGELYNEAKSRYFAVSLRFRDRHASALGINRASVDRVLVLITHGKEIDKFRSTNGDEIPIVMRAEADSPDPLNVFDRLFVTSSSGARIPLSQVIEVTFMEDEYDIDHKLFKPEIEIEISAQPGYSVSKLAREVQQTVSQFQLPPGVELQYGGKLAKQSKSFGGMSKYVGVVGVIVLAIFVFQFGSIVQPLIICVAIPLSFIGAFLLLYVTQQPISFLAFIGLASLMGIVINNSILLVDEGNQLRKLEPELPVVEVAIRAGSNRFMPILPTSITSIAGLLPLALGASMFKPLAIVVIGGLTTSTFLTLILVPVLYVYTSKSDRGTRIVTHRWSGRSALGENSREP